MRIAFGADHAGFELKELLARRAAELGHEVLDLGTSSTVSVDYPDFGFAVGDAVGSGRAQRGVVVCGSGIGISIAANRVPGARAGVATDLYSAQLMREHNDANVLGLGARITAIPLATAILETFLCTPFAGGRHQRRVDKLDSPPPRVEGDLR
ncbi:MAG: ribose 5-phosphate isomerase B [Holophagales bacterium]|jgi:ribose 5-phosphate isomerase B|nr:ribose 5-phosphate isomerase B [Holophagales bacterium]